MSFIVFVSSRRYTASQYSISTSRLRYSANHSALDSSSQWKKVSVDYYNIFSHKEKKNYFKNGSLKGYFGNQNWFFYGIFFGTFFFFKSVRHKDYKHWHLTEGFNASSALAAQKVVGSIPREHTYWLKHV